jgi:hypothetical protein
MRGLLIRVGIDQTPQYGGWNAPVNTENWRYVYVPIRDASYNNSGYIGGGNRVYGQEVSPVLAAFRAESGNAESACFELPARLLNEPMHLDPDFLSLTYGDDSDRGSKLKELGEGDFIAFYASLRPISEDHWNRVRKSCQDRLVYALIGLFVLSSPPVDATNVPNAHRGLNAHTRWNRLNAGDIVVFGKPDQSGLLERCIPIGEFRDRAYRVQSDLLSEWGGLSVKNGWIQRSRNLPEFRSPLRFREWLDKREIRLNRAQYQVAVEEFARNDS